jgi:hypothetical protein
MKVEFINKYYSAKDPQRKITFTAKPKDAETIISALSAFYSGDPYTCKIDGKNAPLLLDHGLLHRITK